MEGNSLLKGTLACVKAMRWRCMLPFKISEKDNAARG